MLTNNVIYSSTL